MFPLQVHPGDATASEGGAAEAGQPPAGEEETGGADKLFLDYRGESHLPENRQRQAML